MLSEWNLCVCREFTVMIKVVYRLLNFLVFCEVERNSEERASQKMLQPENETPQNKKSLT